MNVIPNVAAYVAVILLGWISAAHAQVIPPSPNAGSMAKFANIPVNLYTGTPSIQAPLLTLPGRKMNVPVGLGYHASGIKVQDVSGPVGLGWALQAGGVITRVVKRLPDDSPLGYSSNQFTPTGTSSATGKRLDQDHATGYTRDEVLMEFQSEHADPEPDLFYFNFMGRTGRFVLNAEGEPVLIPHQNVKIVYDRNQDGEITAWDVTTENGYLYSFGRDVTAREVTEAVSSRVSGSDRVATYTSFWYLSEVHSPSDNEKITFEYESGGEVSVWYYNNMYQEDITNCSDPLSDETYYLNTKVTTKPSRRISKITTAQGYVTFGYQYPREDIAGHALTDVRLFDKCIVIKRVSRLARLRTPTMSIRTYENR